MSNIDLLGVFKINGDPLLPMSYNDLIDKPVVLQDKDGISSETGYQASRAIGSQFEPSVMGVI